jgi:hypothetical protein
MCDLGLNLLRRKWRQIWNVPPHRLKNDVTADDFVGPIQ